MIRIVIFAVVATIVSTCFTLFSEWWMGRRLLAWEIVVAFSSVLLALVVWEIVSFRKRQVRNRLRGMRDSALW
ncbi:hypothetical protein DT070_00065 [Polaromonas sp. SP1]|nr:hypothetical protein DT070_00065 [Polaromonas sp. SP1]